MVFAFSRSSLMSFEPLALTSFFRCNKSFHNQQFSLAQIKSNNSERLIVFKNYFTPKVLTHNKTVFIRPIFVKVMKAVIQTCGSYRTFIKPVFYVLHCFGIVIIPSKNHFIYSLSISSF